MEKEKQKYPNFDEEKKCWRRGHRVVAGLDEAGRGPLAGPVVAAAVCAAAKLKVQSEKFKVKDSKKLSACQREEWYKILTNHPDIRWGIGIVSEKIIDKINIFEATKLAMKKAISNLQKSRDYKYYDRVICNRLEAGDDKSAVDFILLDGNFTLEDLSINQKAIIKADEKVFSCAAASIIAKVTRDRIMSRYAKKYPAYGFEKHKGYGTLAHRRALEKHGLCPIHRRSFKFKKRNNPPFLKGD